jgi:hypothetical protein
MNLLDKFKVYPNVRGVSIFNEIQLMNDFDYAHKVQQVRHPDAGGVSSRAGSVTLRGAELGRELFGHSLGRYAHMEPDLH